MSIVDDYPRSATIVVTEPSELLILTKNRFESICRKNPGVGIKFLRGLAKNLSMRLRKTTGRFADLS
jgi:CRP-like cAMP-binding protein